MASPKSPNGADRLSVYETKEELNAKDETAVLDFERPRFSHTKTPDLSAGSQSGTLTPNPPAVLGPFDWDDFEARYEKALVDADDQEQEILKEAESLAKYFQVWSSAASAHDDERAVKRLQTRQRYVNISEEKLAQKQQHYDEVVRFTNLPPQQVPEDQLYEEWEEDEEDDSLGYYEDGVKRTLTDEQIEIFRHSELRELERQREKQAQSKSDTPGDASLNETRTVSPYGPEASTNSRNKKKKKKKSKAVKQEPKPDLRKRTWDVVGAGLDSLDYD
ncbi:hypothetical protein ACQKWADRAFT_315484 [Trichoderma austrokoningii]